MSTAEPLTAAEHIAAEAIRAAAHDLQIQIQAARAAEVMLEAASAILQLGVLIRATHPTA